jgi:glycosyltransferase involved in cell wall biosynthesis
MKLKPKYSIVIPVYKRIFGFNEALESALNVEGCQEIIVVDDNSDHNEFQEICESFGDERIRYSKNEFNIGLFGNWNKGIDLSTGEFVSILCSDDLIEKDAYQLFLDAYKINPSVDVFFGSFSTFVQSPADAVLHREFPDGKMDPVDLMKDAVENGPGFSVLSIIRKSTVQKLPFVAKPHSGNDWLWIYGNASALNLHAISRPINFWRRHPDQDASKSQSITTDCWPLMFLQMEKQLAVKNPSLSNGARKRAKGVVLSWLLNDYVKRDSYYPRLHGEESKTNYFLQNALTLIESDWLLKGLLNAKTGSGFYYNIARLIRKCSIYPAS